MEVLLFSGLEVVGGHVIVILEMLSNSGDLMTNI